ncbi:uncharacterized protein PRCAT00003507001 [Priceomyces carsonii]|uniref:uncharacterized protein n=1 Tax=Priceomyces carsonii TaxID=28549 RepID=UPI002EDAED65|nr:unnamed protein product [Priceomyces carsonii]
MQFEGYAVTDPEHYTTVEKIKFTPKTFDDHDVDIKIIACGICGLDCHTISGGWGKYNVPLIVGHEIIGHVVNVGKKVSTLKVGDRVGVGAQVGACLECDICKSGEETYCPHLIDTYNAKYPDGSTAWGGYASHVRCHEFFTFKIPDKLETSVAAPMLCAGITTYAPIKKNFTGPGMKIGIIGIGGLGHLAIMWAKALGCEVFVFSRGTKKKDDAFKLGADHYFDLTQKEFGENLNYKLDMILSCASSSKSFDINEFLKMLKVRGKFISVGLPEEPFSVMAQSFTGNACFLGSSHLGNRKEMFEMLNLAAEKGVKTWVETIPISESGVKKGLEKTLHNDVRYRVALIDFDKQF